MKQKKKKYLFDNKKLLNFRKVLAALKHKIITIEQTVEILSKEKRLKIIKTQDKFQTKLTKVRQ